MPPCLRRTRGRIHATFRDEEGLAAGWHVGMRTLNSSSALAVILGGGWRTALDLSRGKLYRPKLELSSAWESTRPCHAPEPTLVPCRGPRRQCQNPVISRNLRKSPCPKQPHLPVPLDAVIVGAGFAGLYQLLRLRRAGFTAQVIEAGDSVGGTWYWNRYPGARCDIESLEYQYGFDDELPREWKWSERYATQPEILKYINHVADQFDLRNDIQFETRVTAAALRRSGEPLAGRDRQRRQLLARATASWPRAASPPPRRPTSRASIRSRATGTTPAPGRTKASISPARRVGIIGTGSSGIQSIPHIAAQATHLTVFQRTANFSVPAHNGPIDQEYEAETVEGLHRVPRRSRASRHRGIVARRRPRSPRWRSHAEERQREFETRWEIGGFAIGGAFIDLAINKEANDTAAEFVAQQDPRRP